MKFIFDTNILLKVPSILKNYHKQIIVSNVVFNELDYRKKFPQHQENAQLAIKHIKNYNLKFLPKIEDKNIKNDEKIIKEIVSSKQNIILVSEDEAIHIRAKKNNLKSISLQQFNDLILSQKEKPTDDDLRFFELVKNKQFQEAIIFKENRQLNVNFIITDNLTPLIYFIRKGQKEQFDFWVNLENVDINQYDKAKFPMPPFMHAVQQNQFYMLKVLVQKGANTKLLSKGKNKGNSALLIAVWDNRIKIVKYLLENNLNISINQADNNGFTPLIKAVIKNRIEILKYLLQFNNLDLDICDTDGKSAMDWAKEKNNYEIIRLLERKK